MSAKFGPAGNSDSFYAAGNTATAQVFPWLAQQGLDAYEYQCGRGVRVTEATARALGEQAAAHHIAVSLHAPYFISLASVEEDKRLNSIRYILESARAVTWMGGTRIVVHPGGLGGRTREEATRLAKDTLSLAQQALDAEGWGQVHICPETMGKINQLGTFEEVLDMCEVDTRLIPCVDFGHLNSRKHGEMTTAAQYETVLAPLSGRWPDFHMHFSKIEYSAGGEKRHLTFADTVFGPDPAPLMALCAARGLSPTCICESDGTQTEDAATLKQLWERI